MGALTEPVHRSIAARLRRFQTYEELVSVGERMEWWTKDDVDWVIAGHTGPRPDGWTLEVQQLVPLQAAVNLMLADVDTAARHFAAGLGVEVPAAVRTCRHCGCTDEAACVGNGGRPCHWVAADVCSACTPATAADLLIDALPDVAAPETPPAAADSGEAASDTPAAPVADHRSAPPAASGDLLTLGLQHEDRSVRSAAQRAATAVDELVSALARARRA